MEIGQRRPASFQAGTINCGLELPTCNGIQSVLRALGLLNRPIGVVRVLVWAVADHQLTQLPWQVFMSAQLFDGAVTKAVEH